MWNTLCPIVYYFKDLPDIGENDDFSMLYKKKTDKKKSKKNKIIKTQFDKAKMIAEGALTSALDYITDWSTSGDVSYFN